MTAKYKVWLYAVDEIPGGWMSKNPGAINAPIYGRTTNPEAAQLYSKNLAVRKVLEIRGSGWPCRADPEITETF